MSKIRHATPIFFVNKRKDILDYYKRLGFWVDYNMGFAEREGLMLQFHESNSNQLTASNFPQLGNEALDIFVMVEGIDDLYKELQLSDAIIHYNLRINEFNMKEFAIRDPQGYCIGFGESLV